jgi:NADPH:quinone reductase-like Zn-dependent oxidoreductase
MTTDDQQTMKRVIVDHFGGPDAVKVIEDRIPRPGPGEVRVRVLAAGVSFTDAQLRAGTYIAGAPKPPFTPGSSASSKSSDRAALGWAWAIASAR